MDAPVCSFPPLAGSARIGNRQRLDVRGGVTHFAQPAGQHCFVLRREQRRSQNQVGDPVAQRGERGGAGIGDDQLRS